MSYRGVRHKGEGVVKRNLTVLAAIGLVLAVSTGAFAAQKYVITSSSQIQPGTISYANLSVGAKTRLKGIRGAAGTQGPKGDPGAAGTQGPKGDTGAAGTQGPKGDTGVAGRDGANALAEASGLVAWTADPALILSEGTDTAGSVHGSSVVLAAGQVITSLSELVVSPGVGTSHGMYAIYDKNLNLVAQTVDTPAAFNVTDQWVELPLTSPYTVPAGGLYYFADFIDAATTTPTIGMAGYNTATDARGTLPGGVARNVHDGPGLSALPPVLVNNGTSATRSIVAR